MELHALRKFSKVQTRIKTLSGNCCTQGFIFYRRPTQGLIFFERPSQLLHILFKCSGMLAPKVSVDAKLEKLMRDTRKQSILARFRIFHFSDGHASFSTTTCSAATRTHSRQHLLPNLVVPEWQCLTDMQRGKISTKGAEMRKKTGSWQGFAGAQTTYLSHFVRSRMFQILKIVGTFGECTKWFPGPISCGRGWEG